MKSAVTYDNGHIFQHFGRTSEFKFYDVANGKVINKQVVDTNGAEHVALAGLLKNAQADLLIGSGAQILEQNACTARNINVSKVISVKVKNLVNADEV